MQGFWIITDDQFTVVRVFAERKKENAMAFGQDLACETGLVFHMHTLSQYYVNHPTIGVFYNHNVVETFRPYIGG